MLRSPSDPILAWRRRQVVAGAVGCIAVGVGAVWAWWPLPDPPVLEPVISDAAGAAVALDAGPAFDRGAFGAAIWNPRPAPARPVEERPVVAAAPPLRLELVGISRDAGPDGVERLCAALFDPEAGKLHVAGEGERVRGATLVALSPGGVVLEAGGRRTELRLRIREGGAP